MRYPNGGHHLPKVRLRKYSWVPLAAFLLLWLLLLLLAWLKGA